MSEIEINNLKNLLNNVSLITKKYDDLAEYTGENFNLFDAVGIYQDELSHSAMLGYLLNAKGKHGQKDTFLKLFLEEIKNLQFGDVQTLTLKEFNSEKSHVIVEKHVGKVNHDDAEGGRIDIIINEGKNNIIIENKIWADDQKQQLLRYYNYDKNAPIIYLTLNGKEPSEFSTDKKVNQNVQFVCVSYEDHIINWLGNCIKEMANKPIIRESLNQYLVLLKQLTKQNTNSKMEDEIIELMLMNKQNIISSKLIFESYNNAIIKLKKSQVKTLISILKKNGINEDDISIDRAKRIDGLFITLKTFELSDGVFDLGINVELDNNLFFFCVIRKNDVRIPNVNTDKKFDSIKEYLKKRVLNLNQVNGWTIGKANDFTIGVIREEYYLPSSDNYQVFENFSTRVLEFKRLLEK
jgi:hypothetical protein